MKESWYLYELIAVYWLHLYELLPTEDTWYMCYIARGVTGVFRGGGAKSLFRIFSRCDFSLFPLEISILVDPQKGPQHFFSPFSPFISDFPLFPSFLFSFFLICFHPCPFFLIIFYIFHFFTFFLASFFPISRQIFPGRKSLGGTLLRPCPCPSPPVTPLHIADIRLKSFVSAEHTWHLCERTTLGSQQRHNTCNCFFQ